MLKKYIDFINEKKVEPILVKYMPNKDRKLLQEYCDIINSEFDDDFNLPSYLDRYKKDKAEKIAIFISYPHGYTDLLKHYYVEGYSDFRTLYELTQINVDMWNNDDMETGLLIEETISDLRSVLANGEDDNMIMDHNGKIYILSDAEEKYGLPSIKSIDKYNL